MPSSVDTTRSAFEYQSIKSFVNELDYDAIKIAHDKLKAKTTSSSLTLDDGNHWLIGLIMLDISCLLVSGPMLGLPSKHCLPPIVLDASTATTTYKIIRYYKSSLKFTTRLKIQIEVYINNLHNPNIAFASITFMVLISNIYDYFGEIAALNLAQIEEIMIIPYDPFLPITKLFYQTEEVVAYTERADSLFKTIDSTKKTYLLVLKQEFMVNAIVYGIVT